MGILILAALIILTITVYNRRAEEERLAEDRKALINTVTQDKELFKRLVEFEKAQGREMTMGKLISILQNATKEDFYGLSTQIKDLQYKISLLKLAEAEARLTTRLNRLEK